MAGHGSKRSTHTIATIICRNDYEILEFNSDKMTAGSMLRHLKKKTLRNWMSKTQYRYGTM